MEKMRLMLVDDEERFLETTKKLLARKGYEVEIRVAQARAVRRSPREILRDTE